MNSAIVPPLDEYALRLSAKVSLVVMGEDLCFI